VSNSTYSPPAGEPGADGQSVATEDEGTPLSTTTKKYNFVGEGVTVTEPLPDEFVVTIPGGGAAPVYEAHTAADTLTAAETGSTHSNDGATGIVPLTLPTAPPTATKFSFLRMAAFALRVLPGTGQRFKYSGNAATTITKYLEIGTDTELGTMDVMWDGTRWVVSNENDTYTEEA